MRLLLIWWAGVWLWHCVALHRSFQHGAHTTLSPTTTAPTPLLQIKEVLKKAQADATYVGEARATALMYVAERRLVTPKDAMHAVGVFKLAKDPDSVLLLVDSLLTARGSSSSSSLPAVDTALFNNAIDACAKVAAWEKSLTLLRRMHACQVPADTISFSSAISACAKAGRWQESLALLAEMGAAGVVADTICYSSAISACAGAGRWHESLRLLGTMKRTGVAVDAIAVNSAIAACGAAGQWSVALRLVDALRSEGLRPNAYTYAAAIAACDAGGQVDAALQLLEDMLRENDRPSSEVPFNAAITAAIRGNRPTQAINLFRRMEALGVPRTAVTYTTLVSGLAKARWRHAGHPALVLDLVTSQMVRDGVPRNGAVFGAAIAAAERLGDHRAALQLLDAMHAAEGVAVGSYVYHSAISACSRAGQFDRAVALLDDMKQRGVPRTGVTYSLLIGACKAGGRWRDALRFLADMEADVDVDGGNGDGDCDNGNHDDANDNAAASTVAYSSAIAVCVASKQWEVALELLEKMEGAGVERNVVTYNTVIEALSAAGETVRAELVYQRALSVGVYNHWHRDSPYHALLLQQAAHASASMPTVGSHGAPAAAAAAAAEPVAVMDLHQFPVAVARAAVTHVLGEMCMGALPVGDPLVIITGRGNHVHAKGQRGVLKRQLLQLCADMGLQLLSGGNGNGSDGTHARPANPGRLWLTRAALEEWLAAQKADDERRRAQGQVHGNLFLQVARAKHRRTTAVAAAAAAAPAAAAAAAAAGNAPPINVRAVCPFSSATLPVVEGVDTTVAPVPAEKRGCPAHAAATDPPAGATRGGGGGCPAHAHASSAAGLAVDSPAPTEAAHQQQQKQQQQSKCPAHASGPHT